MEFPPFLFPSPTKIHNPLLNLESSPLEKVWTQQPLLHIPWNQLQYLLVGGSLSPFLLNQQRGIVTWCPVS